MQKIDKFAHAAQVVVLCLPPLVMSLIGLAALWRGKVVRQLSRVNGLRLRSLSDEPAPHEAFAR